MTAALIFAGLALLSTGLVIWQFVVAMRFPLHQRVASLTFAPDISILKPLKGADSETRACLETWLTQRYVGRIQVLFGVHSADDPVCAIVRDLISAHSKVDAELVICGDNLGPNAKVSTLIQLQQRAKHDVIAVSDADVFAPNDLLEQTVAPLSRSGVGLVNCFYRLPARGDIEMRCEAFIVNCDFWSQVLQARSIKPIGFALGAVMITSRARLKKIGGFESLVDYLADDYQLGHRIAKAGGEIVISPVVVECRSAPMTAREVWQHQLRWARTIRVCQPGPYFFSILNDSTLWALLLAAAFPFPRFQVIAASCLAVRWFTALMIDRKMTGRLDFLTMVALLNADLFRPVIWALSFLGNTVLWRGTKYHLLPGGKLVICQ